MKKLNKLGIIGIGDWGKNLVRDFSKISYIKKCTSSGKRENINWLKKNFPHIQYVNKSKEIFSDDEINAVIISTPIKTHYSLIKKALLSKKHVFVEKPISMNIIQANELIKIAKSNNLLLFVGHIFIFNDVLKKIIQISNKEKITHVNFEWNKFGTFDEDIFLNLLSHDLSIILTLFGKPKKIKIHNSFGFITRCDFVRLSVELSKINCLIQINRCSDQKQKRVTISTQKNIYIWDDMKLYKNNNKNNTFKLIFKSKKTPLENECKEFIKQLKDPIKSTTSSKLAKDVIHLIKELR